MPVTAGPSPMNDRTNPKNNIPGVLHAKAQNSAKRPS
jgi:hypothetical protein